MLSGQFLDVDPLMAHGTGVLDVQPLPQTGGVKVMVARSDAGRGGKLLVADGTDVLNVPQPAALDLWEGVDLFNCSPPFDEGLPPILSLQVDVEIGMEAHHTGSDLAAGLEHSVRPVPKHDHAEDKLSDIA